VVRYVYLFGAFRAVFRVSGVAQVESDFAPACQVLKKLLGEGKRIIDERAVGFGALGKSD